MGVTMESTSDLTDAAVRKMIKAAKKRGYVAHDQISSVLPSEEFTSDQIEEIFATLSEMCINVVENEEADTGEADDRRDD
jgi:RNA polymerase primary sigma factor